MLQSVAYNQIFLIAPMHTMAVIGYTQSTCAASQRGNKLAE